MAIVFDVRYEIIGKLGEGTFGTVFLAQDVEKHCYVAVKQLKIKTKVSTGTIIDGA